MMIYLLPALLAGVVAGFTLRMWLVNRRRRLIEANRRVEAPNSHYSSQGVRDLEDRERWGGINMGTLHPLNRDEVSRLLSLVDEEGIHAISGKDRLFLDNMTIPRLGV